MGGAADGDNAGPQLRRGAARVVANVRKHHLRALVHEQPGDRLSRPASRPRHQREREKRGS